VPDESIDPPDTRLDRLEERLAWFERHATEQDKAMLELAKRLDRTQAELNLLRERFAVTGDSARMTSPAEERPPHY